MVQRIVFPFRDKVDLEETRPTPVGAGVVRIRTTHSLISAGTEGIALHELFDQDSHWAAFVRYPFHPGYSAVGVIEEIGPDVTGFAMGDRVAARLGHASEHVVDATVCTRVPDDVDPSDATWFGLAKIALMGAQAAGYEIGDAVAVIGAGPVGQMSLRWARAAGATDVVVVDTVEARLKTALRGGATAIVSAPADEALEDILAACEGRRPRVVIDSTGNAAVFAAALSVVADRGRVVLLGDTGSPASQHLTPDVIVRGLSIVGAHDSHSMTSHDWDHDRRLHEHFFHLVRTGRFPLDGLVTHAFSPRDCAAAYETATRRGTDALGVVFDWLELT